MMEYPNLEGKTCPPSLSVPKNEKNPGAAPVYTPVKKPPFKPTKWELGAALYTYLLGWFYWCGVVAGEPFTPFTHQYFGLFNPVLLGIFCLAFFGGAEVFLRRTKGKAPAESHWWLVFSALLLADLVIFRPLVMGKTYWDVYAETSYQSGFYGWEVFALHIAAVYWLIDRAGLLTGGKTGCFAVVDALAGLLVRPFRWFFLRIQVLAHWIAKPIKKLFRAPKESRQEVRRVLLGLLILVPVFCVAVSLLMQADRAFAHLLSSFAIDLHMPQWFMRFLPAFIVSLPIGAYLFGILGSAMGQSPDPEKESRWLCALKQRRCVPEGTLLIGLAAFCGLYLLFFGVQAMYLTTAFGGRLPAGYTAAEYARQGFFQLCAVVILNFALLGLVYFVKKGLAGRKILKGFAAALMTANLLFGVVGAAKMALYVCRFGFTDKRVLSSWIMLVLMVFSVLALVRLYRPFASVRWGVGLAAVLFAVLCLCQPQYLSYKATLGLYESGILNQLDCDTLRRQYGGSDDYKFVSDLKRVGWGPGHTAEQIYEMIYRYPEIDAIKQLPNPERNDTVSYFVLQQCPGVQKWAVAMHSDENDLVWRMDVLPLEQLLQSAK